MIAHLSVTLLIGLIIVLSVGCVYYSLNKEQKEVEPFELLEDPLPDTTDDSKRFNFRNCTVYYTDSVAKSEPEMYNLRKACDNGMLDHHQLFYDMKMDNSKTADEKAAFSLLKDANARLPNINGSKGICKLNVPNWKQTWTTDAPDPPILSQPITYDKDGRGPTRKWAFCTAPTTTAYMNDPNIITTLTTISNVSNDNIDFANFKKYTLKSADTNTTGTYMKAKFSSLDLQTVQPLYCTTIVKTDPFMNGLIFQVNRNLIVKNIKFAVNATAFSTDNYFDTLKTLFMNMLSEEKVVVISNYEYTYREPILYNYSIVKMSKDACGNDVQEQAGQIDITLRFDLINATNTLVPAALKNCVILKRVPTVSPAFPAEDVGPYNMPPWSANVFGRIDPNARMIWNKRSYALCNPCADINRLINFQQVMFNSSASPMDVSLYIIIDDYADIYLNNISLGRVSGGWWLTSLQPVKMTLKSGQNVLKIAAINGGGPGSLLYSVLNANGSPIIHSDTGTLWYY